MAYGSATTRAKTPGTSTSSNVRTSAMQDGPGNNEPTCEHGQAMIRLECKNGNNKGRFFYKCAQDQNKCRKFIWEDQQKFGASSNQRAASSIPSSSSHAPRSSGPAFGNGGNVLGGRPAAQIPQSSPSSSTEYTQSQPTTPSKRRRGQSEDDIEDPDNHASSSSNKAYSRNHTTPSTPPTWRGFQSRASAAPPSSSQQSLEEAIDDDFTDDIADFDDFENGGNGQQESPSKGKGKFVSFGGPTTPKLGSGRMDPPSTPPSARLAPGLPVTPKSINNKNGNGSVGGPNPSSPHWNTILSDPSSPFHARANALLGGGQQPKSSSNTSILSGSTDPLLDPSEEAPNTPSTSQPAPVAPQTPSEHLSSLSLLADSFSSTLRSEMASATKSAQSTERQLKAMKQKAAYHEKKEKDAKEEIENLKEKMRMLQAENAQLKAGIFA